MRVLTVHRAEGSRVPDRDHDWPRIIPVVSQPRTLSAIGVTGSYATANDSRGHSWSTPGYEDACEVEKALEDAEEIRLTYVASTRARDHLILGLHHKAGAKPEIPAVAFAETLASMVGDVREIEPMELVPPLIRP